MNLKSKKNYLCFNELSNKNIVNLFTLKPFNFRGDLVSKEHINSQYNTLENILGIKFIKILKPCQNHTNNVQCVNESNINDDFNDTDGLITNLPNVTLITSVADCQSILLFDKEKRIIGNIHSGWKGTLNKIIVNAINLMINKYNSNTEDIEVYFCPSILKCCFEVDEDVRDLFIDNFKDININTCISVGNIKNDKLKYYIDTIRVNKLELLKLGIKNEHIFFSNICSKCNSEKIHSYRGDGEKSGRNISLICIK